MYSKQSQKYKSTKVYCFVLSLLFTTFLWKNKFFCLIFIYCIKKRKEVGEKGQFLVHGRVSNKKNKFSVIFLEKKWKNLKKWKKLIIIFTSFFTKKEGIFPKYFPEEIVKKILIKKPKMKRKKKAFLRGYTFFYKGE